MKKRAKGTKKPKYPMRGTGWVESSEGAPIKVSYIKTGVGGRFRVLRPASSIVDDWYSIVHSSRAACLRRMVKKTKETIRTVEGLIVKYQTARTNHMMHLSHLKEELKRARG
jgi:hypothetical protein